MPLVAADFEEGIRIYWHEIASRSRETQELERSFPSLSGKFYSRQPPHFTRPELEHIIKWKYSDHRWRNRALGGLTQVHDDRLRDLTSMIHRLTAPEDAARALRGAIYGVGIAGISAVLSAARPGAFPVIDVFALTAIDHYYNPPWLAEAPRDPKGRIQPNENLYGPYTQFCKARACELSKSTGNQWTPRCIDMALWGIGKHITETQSAQTTCAR